TPGGFPGLQVLVPAAALRVERPAPFRGVPFVGPLLFAEEVPLLLLQRLQVGLDALQPSLQLRRPGQDVAAEAGAPPGTGPPLAVFAGLDQRGEAVELVLEAL